MTEAYVCNAIRTPIGRYGGALASVDNIICVCANQASKTQRVFDKRPKQMI